MIKSERKTLYKALNETAYTNVADVINRAVDECIKEDILKEKA